jgi:ribonucleoside-diphosphate reductase alpha chain
MSKVGGGTSGYFGEIRPRGSKIGSGGESTGVHHQLTVFDSLTNYISQGNVRRGSFAAYLPVDHPDIEEFLRIRSEGDNIQDLSIGVCVSDDWMKSMIEGDSAKRKLWGQIIKKRFESGYPYIFFTDNANRQAPQVYKDKGLTSRSSFPPGRGCNS